MSNKIILLFYVYQVNVSCNLELNGLLLQVLTCDGVFFTPQQCNAPVSIGWASVVNIYPVLPTEQLDRNI